VSRRPSKRRGNQRPRRPGVLPTVGLVVEGDAEYDAIPRLHTKKLIARCPPLRATNLGGVGSHVTPAAIAKMAVGSVIAHQVAGRTKVIVCIDREQRNECSGQFAGLVHAALVVELTNRNRSISDVHVVVANRAFEAMPVS
jgi:hypothetical protein